MNEKLLQEARQRFGLLFKDKNVDSCIDWIKNNFNELPPVILLISNISSPINNINL